jgi:hypothetical protein
MSTYPTVDESGDRLHRAGWSVGEINDTRGPRDRITVFD